MTAPAQHAAPAAHLPTAAAMVRLFADIKLAHTVFALPFALLGGALVLDPERPLAEIAGLLAMVLLCMVAARTWAMVFNRLADHRIDAENPRTRQRAVASGAVRPRDARILAVASAILFLLTTAGFWAFDANPWPLAWSAPVLAWIAFYSITKRFTALCHLVLGISLGLSPIAAAVAVAPDAVLHTPALWLIAGMVVVWVAGFDVIYALQDLDFDRDAGLRSVPAALGWRGALWVSRGLHALAIIAIAGAWLADDRLGTAFVLAVLATAALLITEHAVLIKRGSAGLQMAFFTLNGVLSLAVGTLGIVDLLT